MDTERAVLDGWLLAMHPQRSLQNTLCVISGLGFGRA
jgi:hypothetical protein